MCELSGFRALTPIIIYFTFSEIVGVSMRQIKKKRVASPEPGSPAYKDLPAVTITYVVFDSYPFRLLYMVPDIGYVDLILRMTSSVLFRPSNLDRSTKETKRLIRLPGLRLGAEYVFVTNLFVSLTVFLAGPGQSCVRMMARQKSLCYIPLDIVINN
jgi:hypothetical protein